MRWMRDATVRGLRCAGCFVLLMVAWLPAYAQAVVAITFDDLPVAGQPSRGEADAITERLLAALGAAGASSDAFVTGVHAEPSGEADRYDLLRRWVAAGHRLHNHGYAHLRFSDLDTSAAGRAAFLADLGRGQQVVDAVQPRLAVRFFRAPYNDLGATAEAHRALRSALQAQDVQMAPFTVEHSDYLFDAVYRSDRARADTARAAQVMQAYLAQLDTAFAFAERLAAETFGRPIPHVFLLHANTINADALPAMLARLRARGYRFAPLSEVVADPAYDAPDGYDRRWGVSWLHRWRAGLGLPSALRREPEPPAWVTEAYESR